MSDSGIRAERRGAVGLVTLDRPRALNALTLEMIRVMDHKLAEWAEDPAVRAVVVVGSGDKAFCAGGDVRAVHDSVRVAPSDLHRVFFCEEYALNRRIHRYPKPYVALIHGVTMGGGVGISVHGSHRVATESTMFAMPETALGFFPDVGGSWFLPRLPGATGTYLALTGHRLGVADLLALGIATHAVPAKERETLMERLAAMAPGEDAAGQIDAALSGLALEAGPPPLSGRRAAIDRCFSADRVEEILERLAGEGDEWAQSCRAELLTRSPTSLKVTLEQMRRGRGLDIEPALIMEYRISQHLMTRPDFFEGVRSILIDKDRSPKWRPDTLAGVAGAAVDDCFAPLGDRDLTF